MTHILTVYSRGSSAEALSNVNHGVAGISTTVFYILSVYTCVGHDIAVPLGCTSFFSEGTTILVIV